MNRYGKVELAVTGGSGFIARGVLEGCVEAGLTCRALSRSSGSPSAGQATEWFPVPAYSDTAVLTRAIVGASYVLHLADNPMRDDTRSTEAAERVCDALIEAVRNSGVKGVIVASSVYATQDLNGKASSYGSVKRMIEQKFLSATDIQTIILRLPPVYGPGGRGGLASLSRLVHRRLPLPLGAANAPRSYLSRRNLASLIVTIASMGDDAWTNAANRIYEPSDGVAVSTRELVQMMGAAMGRTSRLLPVPLALLRALGAMAGRSELVSGAIDRLDIAPVEELEAAFGWRPVERMPESLAFLRDEVSPS